MPPRMALVALLGIFLQGIGCSTVPKDPPLEVSLVDFRFNQATVFETTATAVIRIENSQPEPIHVQGGAFRLELNGTRIGRALSDATVVVPRLSTMTTDAQVFLRNLSVVPLLRQFRDAGVVEYTLEGTLYVADAAGGRAHSVRVTRAGRLDLKGLGVPQNVPSR